MPDQESDLRWLACALDSEGSISICAGRPSCHARSGWHFGLVLQVANSSESFSREALRIAGCGRLWKEPGKKGGYKPMFKWQTYGFKAKYVLERVCPYLLVKREQALLALRFPRLDGVRGRPAGIFQRLAQAEGWRHMKEMNRGY